jgi:hypothetical protein
MIKTGNVRLLRCPLKIISLSGLIFMVLGRFGQLSGWVGAEELVCSGCLVRYAPVGCQLYCCALGSDNGSQHEIVNSV